MFVLKYPVRHFSEYRQQILDDMIINRRKICPDVVYSPSTNDIHQDHFVIAEEAKRAFKSISLYAYEVPWNNYVFNNQRFNILEKEHVEKKTSAIECYESQHGRMYANKDFIISQTKLHGIQMNKEYAEVFGVIRQVIE